MGLPHTNLALLATFFLNLMHVFWILFSRILGYIRKYYAQNQSKNYVETILLQIYKVTMSK
jgi:hypothetical protein